MTRLVQKFFPKQTDIDKILEIIQQKVIKGTHLSITIKRYTSRIIGQFLFLRYISIPSPK